jgi:hypothetical protein
MAAADLQWTSVPCWRAPELPAAACYLACWFGDQARTRVTELLAGARPGATVTVAAFPARWDTPTEAELTRLLGDCRTGVRIILAGPEATVMRAQALARGQGATAEELVLLADEAAETEYATGPGERRVFCVTCQRPHQAVAALGELVTCPGCGSGLTVDQRFSRAHAAYFGWPSGLDSRH